MPRHAKGPRLYLRTGRVSRGQPLPDVYVVRDGGVEVSTGCGPDRLAEAEQALLVYLTTKRANAPRPNPGDAGDRRPRDPSTVLVADVIAYYASDRAPELASNPKSVSLSLGHLLGWWGDKTCADVIRSNCKAYVAHRVLQPVRSFKDPAKARLVDEQTARRELEDLSAAIGHWHGERPFTSRPEIWLPPKRESPREAMTRAQAAQLLKAALGWRLGEDGRWTRVERYKRERRAHLRRFILIGLYTGTRHAVIRALLWEESAHQAWVDLDSGMIYRRGAKEREQRTKRRPVVKLPPRLTAHMTRWRRLDAAREAKIRAEQKARGEEPDFQLNSVIHFAGRPLAGKIRTGFAACVHDAGLPEEITPHWMRHTAATWLMEAGVDPWVASGWLGMSLTTLLQHYGHLRPDYQADAAGAWSKRS